ncbi:epimerase [Halobacteriales archaeon QH_3_68_24]|nr:MAG: epimerase [Halobacteriales archaeon QH_3_68_24]
MSDHALFVGGTRFIGRHAVREFRDAGYDVTTVSRGEHDNPFADDEGVAHLQGDRDDEATLGAAADRDPDVVVDDDSRETYGPRKAEGDREVFAAAERGVHATSIRPTVVYGPHDYTRRFDFWVHRVANYDRVLVPGDGNSLWHLAYVSNVARALRRAAENGDPGEAYNVGDWDLHTLEGIIRAIADELDTSVEVVTAGERELAAGGLEPTDFPLYRPSPHVLDTHRLRGLGWEPITPEEGVAETVATSPATDARAAERGPDRADEERVLGVLDTV